MHSGKPPSKAYRRLWLEISFDDHPCCAKTASLQLPVTPISASGFQDTNPSSHRTETGNRNIELHFLLLLAPWLARKSLSAGQSFLWLLLRSWINLGCGEDAWAATYPCKRGKWSVHWFLGRSSPAASAPPSPINPLPTPLVAKSATDADVVPHFLILLRNFFIAVKAVDHTVQFRAL